MKAALLLLAIATLALAECTIVHAEPQSPEYVNGEPSVGGDATGSADNLEATVKKIIGESRVAIFSKSYCPYCKKTKALFRKLGVNATVVELDQIEYGKELQTVLRQLTGQRTVPNVFVGGKHLGGSDDTAAASHSGKLARMLKAAGEDLEADRQAHAMERVRELIGANKVMLFSKSYCPYCMKAKKLLRAKQVEYHVVELDKDADGHFIAIALKQLTGQHTVPNVYIGGKHVGGADDLYALDAQGELDGMLA